MARVTFQGPWHEPGKQKVSDGLADLFNQFQKSGGSARIRPARCLP